MTKGLVQEVKDIQVRLGEHDYKHVTVGRIILVANPLIGTFTGPNDEKTLVFDFSPQVFGRFLTIQTTTKPRLSISEVTLYTFT